MNLFKETGLSLRICCVFILSPNETCAYFGLMKTVATSAKMFSRGFFVSFCSISMASECVAKKFELA